MAGRDLTRSDVWQVEMPINRVSPWWTAGDRGDGYATGTRRLIAVWAVSGQCGPPVDDEP